MPHVQTQQVSSIRVLNYDCLFVLFVWSKKPFSEREPTLHKQFEFNVKGQLFITFKNSSCWSVLLDLTSYRLLLLHLQEWVFRKWRRLFWWASKFNLCSRKFPKVICLGGHFFEQEPFKFNTMFVHVMRLVADTTVIPDFNIFVASGVSKWDK